MPRRQPVSSSGVLRASMPPRGIRTAASALQPSQMTCIRWPAFELSLTYEDTVARSAGRYRREYPGRARSWKPSWSELGQLRTVAFDDEPLSRCYLGVAPFTRVGSTRTHATGSSP